VEETNRKISRLYAINATKAKKIDDELFLRG